MFLVWTYVKLPIYTKKSAMHLEKFVSPPKMEQPYACMNKHDYDYSYIQAPYRLSLSLAIKIGSFCRSHILQSLCINREMMKKKQPFSVTRLCNSVQRKLLSYLCCLSFPTPKFGRICCSYLHRWCVSLVDLLSNALNEACWLEGLVHEGSCKQRGVATACACDGFFLFQRGFL